MPSFRYRALTQAGETRHRLDRGADRGRGRPPHRISRPGPDRHRHRGERPRRRRVRSSRFGKRPRAEDVTIFTLDLALLLQGRRPHRRRARTACRATSTSAGLRPVVAKVRASVLVGRKLRRCALAPPGAVPADVCRAGAGRRGLRHARPDPRSARRRTRARRGAAPQARRRAALSRPSCCSRPVCVLLFFLLFVLPQFAAVLRDFGAKLDPIVRRASSAFRISCARNGEVLAAGVVALIAGGLAPAARGRSRAPRIIAGARAAAADPPDADLSSHRPVLPQSRRPARRAAVALTDDACASWST